MQNQLINKARINVNVCQQAIFYWEDSQDVYLTFATREPHWREFWLKKAENAKTQAMLIHWLLNEIEHIH